MKINAQRPAAAVASGAGPLLLATALLSFAPSTLGEVFRVDAAAGSDVGSCGTAAAPCANIQRAVNLAASDDEVRVAQGTYLYQPGLDPCPASNTGVVCIVNERLTLIGGFDGTDWTTPDAAANPTIIDGGSSLRGVLVTRTFPGAPAAALVLAGVTVRHGRALGAVGASPDGANGRGGGIKAALSDLVLRDVVLEDNEAVGAVTDSGAGGSGVGGGLFVASTPSLLSTVVLERVSFLRNQGNGSFGPDRGGLAEGGGMFMNHGTLQAVDLLFEDNSVVSGDSTGGGVAGGLRADALGGGLAILAGVDAEIRGLVVTGSTVAAGDADASAGSAGGAFGGGVYVERSAVVLRDVELRGNDARGGDASKGGIGAGGGLMSFDGDVDLSRCEIVGNAARGGTGGTTKGSAGGGGLYLERASDPAVSARIGNCVVAENLVELGSGGGVVGGGGGGLFVLGNDAALDHVTLADNALSTSPLVGQALVVVNRSGSPSHADLRYSIVADHDSLPGVAAVHVLPNASIDLLVNLFAGNANDTNQGASSGSYEGEETSLAAGSAGFVAPGPPSSDYHLAAGSPAVGEAAGSEQELDLDVTRRSHPRDLGADERCQAAEDHVVLAGGTVVGASLEAACLTLTAGAVSVENGGDLTLQAGRRIVLQNGFQVLSGGRLAVIDTVP